jgi:hypothetical protein
VRAEKQSDPKRPGGTTTASQREFESKACGAGLFETIISMGEYTLITETTMRSERTARVRWISRVCAVWINTASLSTVNRTNELRRISSSMSLGICLPGWKRLHDRRDSDMARNTAALEVEEEAMVVEDQDRSTLGPLQQRQSDSRVVLSCIVLVQSWHVRKQKSPQYPNSSKKLTAQFDLQTFSINDSCKRL